MLYKYVSMDVAKVILQTSTLGFTRPSDFNDPFDEPVAIPASTKDAPYSVIAVSVAGDAKGLSNVRSAAGRQGPLVAQARRS